MYSTFKYRKSVPYKVTVTETDYLSTLYERMTLTSCTITGIPDVVEATLHRDVQRSPGNGA